MSIRDTVRGLAVRFSRDGLSCLIPARLLGRQLDALGVMSGRFAYRAPAFVQIDLTNDCNNDCIGCWCNSPLLEEKKVPPEVKRQTIPFRNAVRLIDELWRSGTTHLYFAGGGEPFMHPRLLDILRHAKRRGMVCYVNTNFTLVDEAVAAELVRMKLDHMTVSVWAGTPSVYAATHPNKNGETFLRIKESLARLNRIKKTGPVIKVYNVVFSMNWHDLEPMLSFAMETGSESVEFTVIDTIPGKTDRLMLTSEQRAALRETCAKLKASCDRNRYKGVMIENFDTFIRRISNTDASRAEYDSDIITAQPCYAGWAFCRILADGNVNSCLKSHRFPVGNIYEQPFGRIWNGWKQRLFREKTLNFDPADPFFRLIGNDPDSKTGCFKSCDNIGHNCDLHGRISSLSPLEKRILEGCRKVLASFEGNGKSGHG